VQPFLENSQTVLLAGAGGGFDIYCGLPLYDWLLRNGKRVHLANLSFTPQIPEFIYKVEPGNEPETYYPEQHLANFLQQPVYALQNDGPMKAQRAYQWMAEEFEADTLVLIDGGSDILMRGDEEELGTPEEDMTSLVAAFDCKIPQKWVVCLGFGIDSFHGVCHALFLENVAALIRDGAYRGSWSLQKESQEFQLLKQAYAYAAQRQRSSIVNSSIIAAVEGQFGNHHSTERTQGSELFINPLMGLYWAFDLEGVARRNLYLELIRGLPSRQVLSRKIHDFHRALLRHRPCRKIPC